MWILAGYRWQRHCAAGRRGKEAALEVWFCNKCILKEFLRKNFLLKSTKSTTLKCLLEIGVLYTYLYLTESKLQKFGVFLGGRLMVWSQLVSERSGFTLQHEFQVILIKVNTITNGIWKDKLRIQLLTVYEKTS